MKWSAIGEDVLCRQKRERDWVLVVALLASSFDLISLGLQPPLILTCFWDPGPEGSVWLIRSTKKCSPVSHTEPLLETSSIRPVINSMLGTVLSPSSYITDSCPPSHDIELKFFKITFDIRYDIDFLKRLSQCVLLFFNVLSLGLSGFSYCYLTCSYIPLISHKLETTAKGLINFKLSILGNNLS